jgi:hypothetical protein
MRLARSCFATGKFLVFASLMSLAVCVLNAQTLTVVHNFTGGPDGGAPLAGLTADHAGNFYGTTQEGGTGNCFRGCGAIFKLSNRNGNWIIAPLYEFLNDADGRSPSRLVFGPDGSLYGTTTLGGVQRAAAVPYLVFVLR